MIWVRNCPGCGVPARGVCGYCVALFRSARAPGRPPPGIDRMWMLAPYCSATAPVVLAAKNRARLDVVRQLGRMLADPCRDLDVDVVCGVPASSIGSRRRGYDQSRELAKVVARSLGVRHRQLVRRARSDAPQRSRDAAGRRAGPSVTARNSPPAVLLIDDVITTGGSLSAAAAALRSAGAEVVIAAALTGSGWALRPGPNKSTGPDVMVGGELPSAYGAPGSAR